MYKICIVLLIVIFGCNMTENINSDSTFSDEEMTREIAKDLYNKITTSFHQRTLRVEEGKPVSVGLVYARDERTKGDTSFAFYISQKILNYMSQFYSSPYVIVATDREREEILKKCGTQLDSVFDQTQISEGLGRQIPANIGMFIEMRFIRGNIDEITVKLFTIYNGALFYAKSYLYRSDFLGFIRDSKSDIDFKEAEEYWHLNSNYPIMNGSYRDLPEYTQVDRIAQEVISIYQTVNHYVAQQHWRIEDYIDAKNRLMELRRQISTIFRDLNYQAKSEIKHIFHSINILGEGISEIIYLIKENK